MIIISKWLVLSLAAGAMAGSASALFLFGLNAVTDARIGQPWLLWLLPAGGALISWLYAKYGGDSAKGNNLIIDQAYGGGTHVAVPLRMAPLVLIGTWMTHLLGGSAGREGTAVQMGGSLSEFIGRRLQLSQAGRSTLLMCGVSAGFGSVFGTPAAGALFGVELLAAGGIARYNALLPCIVSAYAGSWVTEAWGIEHSHYSMGPIPEFSWLLLGQVALAAVLFGLAAMLFSELTHTLKRGFAVIVPHTVLRAFVGGTVIIALVYAVGTRDYIGLGLPLMKESFMEAVSPAAFALKTLFTSVTLGAGFQGGEVTPLFVIGSTLGSALAGLLHLSVPFLAGIGLVSVFSGAANTPIACTIMGIELFGIEGAGYVLLSCMIAYAASWHSGIYTSQRYSPLKRWMLRLPAGHTRAMLLEMRTRNKKG